MKRHTESKDSCSTWLKDTVWIPRYNRTITLVKNSVDTLNKNKDNISINTIIEMSKKIDPLGSGISKNALLNNPDAYEYYKSHSSFRAPKAKGKNSTQLNIPEKIKIKENRDLQRVKNRYGKLTKRELINRIIILEEYIVSNNTDWLNQVFSQYPKS